MHPAVRFHEPVGRLDKPILVAGIASRGRFSSSLAVGHLMSDWDVRLVAEIDPDDYYDFNVLRPNVRLEDGVRTLEWPESRFYVARPKGSERDVVLFTAIEPHYHWRDFIAAVDSIAVELGVEESIFVGIRPGATPHTRPIPVELRDGDESTARSFGLPSTSSDYQGPTSIATVMALGHRQRGWRGGVVSAMRPFYIGVESSPHAVAAVADVIAGGLGATVDTSGLRDAAAQIDRQMAAAMEQSEELAAFVAELERQYDATRLLRGPTALTVSESPPDTGQLMAEIDQFLRGHQDAKGRGEAPRTH